MPVETDANFPDRTMVRFMIQITCKHGAMEPHTTRDHSALLIPGRDGRMGMKPDCEGGKVIEARSPTNALLLVEVPDQDDPENTRVEINAEEKTVNIQGDVKVHVSVAPKSEIQT